MNNGLGRAFRKKPETDWVTCGWEQVTQMSADVHPCRGSPYRPWNFLDLNWKKTGARWPFAPTTPQSTLQYARPGCGSKTTATPLCLPTPASLQCVCKGQSQKDWGGTENPTAQMRRSRGGGGTKWELISRTPLFLSGELEAWHGVVILVSSDPTDLVLMHNLGLKELEGGKKSLVSWCWTWRNSCLGRITQVWSWEIAGRAKSRDCPQRIDP